MNISNLSERLETAFRHRSWIRFPIYFARDFLTLNGKIFLACAALSAPLSFVAINTTAYFFFTMITATFITAFIINFIYRPHVSCSRILPGLLEAGGQANYQVTISNTGKKTLYRLKLKEVFWSVYIEYPEKHVLESLLPGESVSYEASLLPKKRGPYNSEGLVVSSNFPFDLFNWGKKTAIQGKMVVFPSYTRLETFELALGRKFQPGGIALSSHVGDSTEFIGTREYVFGDNPRHIHWKSWAKTGKPVVKEFQEEYFVRLALIIDTQVAQTELFEKGLSMAASVADYLSRFDYIIDVFAAGNQFYHFQAGRSLAHFENILELLACIEPCKKVYFNHVYTSLSGELSGLSGIILIFMDWDDEREKVIRELLGQGIGLRVLIFNNAITKEISVELKDIVSIQS
jgi:uncharacterized protein (DUF58 family)